LLRNRGRLGVVELMVVAVVVGMAVMLMRLMVVAVVVGMAVMLMRLMVMGLGL
jgi:uncharacterized membrane protein YuzA (DUF378 family)